MRTVTGKKKADAASHELEAINDMIDDEPPLGKIRGRDRKRFFCCKAKLTKQNLLSKACKFCFASLALQVLLCKFCFHWRLLDPEERTQKAEEAKKAKIAKQDKDHQDLPSKQEPLCQNYIPTQE